MAEKEQPRQASHRAYSVVRRDGQDDYWLDVGHVFPHKDGSGFNIMLQVFPLDGKIVCREIAGDHGLEEVEAPPPARSRRSNAGRRSSAARR